MAGGQESEVLDDHFVIFDCRNLADPEGRGIGPNGTDAKVQEWVWHGVDPQMFASIQTAIHQSRDLAFGCYAGKNRSVAMAEWAAKYARHLGPIDLEHRDLHVWA